MAIFTSRAVPKTFTGRTRALTIKGGSRFARFTNLTGKETLGKIKDAKSYLETADHSLTTQKLLSAALFTTGLSVGNSSLNLGDALLHNSGSAALLGSTLAVGLMSGAALSIGKGLVNSRIRNVFYLSLKNKTKYHSILKKKTAASAAFLAGAGTMVGGSFFFGEMLDKATNSAFSPSLCTFGGILTGASIFSFGIILRMLFANPYNS